MNAVRGAVVIGAVATPWLVILGVIFGSWRWVGVAIAACVAVLVVASMIPDSD